MILPPNECAVQLIVGYSVIITNRVFINRKGVFLWTNVVRLGKTTSDILNWAQVAELVDAQVSGICGRKAVEVQVLSWAPF